MGNNIGSLVYSVEMQTAKFVAGTKATKTEFNQLRKVARETGGPLAKLQADFATLTKVGREAGKSLEVAAISFGKLSAAQKGAGHTARTFIAQLKKELQIFKERIAFGDVLNKQERAWMAQLERTIPAYEKSMQAQRRATAEERKAELQKRRSERAAKAAARQEEELRMQRERALRTINSNESAIRRLARAQRELRQAYRQGAITQAEFERGQAGIRQRLQAQQRQLGPMTRMWGGLVRQIALVTIAYRALRFAQNAVNTALELERQEKQFEIFTGNAEVAERLRNELQNLAATTPLVLSSTMQATKTLLQYGVASNDVVETTRRLGDVSGGSHESLQRLSLAFGQITANGRLQGQELRQLIEAGFNPLQTISERTGESMLSLRDKMADGEITIQMVRQALVDATSEGGRFNNALNEIARNTSFGKIQVMLGQLEVLAVDVAEEWAEAFGKIAEHISGVLTEINEQRSREEQARKNATKEELALLDEMIEKEKRARAESIGMLEPLVNMGGELDHIVDQWAIIVINRRKEAEAAAEAAASKAEADKASEMADSAAAARIDELRQKYRKEIEELNGVTQAQRDLAAARQAAAEGGEEAQEALQNLIALQQEAADLKAAEEQKEADKEYFEAWEEFTENLQAQNEKDAKKKAEEHKKEMDRLKEKAQAHRDMLDENSKYKEQLKEIAQLELMGLLSEDVADERREQLKKEFMEQQQDKIKADKGRAAGAASGSKEEYNILKGITDRRRHQKKIEAHQKKAELFWSKMEGLAERIAKATEELEPVEGVEKQ